MEKLIYALWKKPDQSQEDFNERLLGALQKGLRNKGAAHVQLNVADSVIATTIASQMWGSEIRVNLKPMPAAIVSFWLNSSHIRGPYEKLLEEACPRIAGYVASESTVIPYLEVINDGEKTPGFSQVAFIRRPPRLSPEAWLQQWLSTQTKLAGETQTIFHYCQNVVTRQLTYGAPHLDAIVEELWPTEAMMDPDIFFKGEGSMEKQKLNRARQLENVAKFIDFDKCDLLYTSQYRFGQWIDITGQPSIESI